MFQTREELSLHNISIYITSRLNRFIQDTTLRRIIGQQKTSFDFEKIMNSGKILLIKMGKGRFGPVVSFATEKDNRGFYPNRAEQHRRLTQRKYGMYYQDVDEQIARRRDIIYKPVD